MIPAPKHAEYVFKQFYTHFKREQEYFLHVIEGISSPVDAQRYVTLLLTRLMFIYFLQKKGLFNGDPNFLRHQLHQLQTQQKGQEQFSFLTFYQNLLQRLFHEKDSHPIKPHFPAMEELLSKLPYLNGALLDQHLLEQPLQQPRIPNNAFERLFTFFDCYLWQLNSFPDEQSVNNVINPDVIGSVFEQLMKQKRYQKGAYYTKDDITIYMASNTIIPRILEAVEQQCPDAFHPRGPLWRRVQEHPDRYIYEALKKGCSVPLPDEIAAGREHIAQRTSWNSPLPQSFRPHALPAETWHELIARRERYIQLQTSLSSGAVNTINDFITLNLNIRQLMQDVIEKSDDPKVIWTCYCILTGTDPATSPAIDPLPRLSILDPTCGSGAFLLAALHVLEPIYGACLERMQHMLDTNQTSSNQSFRPLFQEFRSCLDATNHYPGRSFFILQSIVTNNLYGIDLVPESVEICRLRLFLKLVAQVDAVESTRPLPDVHFNIHAGNILVGFSNMAETSSIMSIIQRGGFEVIIGNPPYLSSGNIDEALPDNETKFPNIYAYILIRVLSLCTHRSRLGMIVPLSLTFSKDFIALRTTLTAIGLSWFSSYDTIPAALFTDVHQRCTIWLAAHSPESHLFVTPLYRWRAEARSTLLSKINYTPLNDNDVAEFGLPKLASQTQQYIFTRIKATSALLPRYFRFQNGQGTYRLGFSQAARNFISVFLEPPPCLDTQTFTPTATSKIGYLTMPTRESATAALALLAGDVYFWYWLVRGDGFDVTKRIIVDFLSCMNALSDTFFVWLIQLGQLLHASRFEALVFKKNARKYVGNYNYRAVSHLTRRADLLLLAALEIERTEALELLYDVQRVLSINEQAGEKAIPDTIKNTFSKQPLLSTSTEQSTLATIDSALTGLYGLTTEELHNILTMTGKR